MANPALNEKRFKTIRKEDSAGWAAPETLAHADGASRAPRRGAHRGDDRERHVREDVRASSSSSWPAPPSGGRRPSVSTVTNEVQIPGWAWICLFVGFGLAMVCVFKPKASPFVSPLYAIVEGLFLGVISKAFESQWNGIVFQAVLATIAVFFATLLLYVLGVVKVTRKFQMVVIGATCGVFLLYVFGALLSLFGVDVVFWNDPSPFGIIFSVVICCVAALNLFLDYEFIRQSSIQGAPKYMEWYGAFGIMVTLVWLYLEILRLLSLLRQ